MGLKRESLPAADPDYPAIGADYVRFNVSRGSQEHQRYYDLSDALAARSFGRNWCPIQARFAAYCIGASAIAAGLGIEMVMPHMVFDNWNAEIELHQWPLFKRALENSKIFAPEFSQFMLAHFVPCVRGSGSDSDFAGRWGNMIVQRDRADAYAYLHHEVHSSGTEAYGELEQPFWRGIELIAMYVPRFRRMYEECVLIPRRDEAEDLRLAIDTAD